MGNPGDWCIDTTTGNIFLKTVIQWVSVKEALKQRAKRVTIYRSAKTRPSRPTQDINVGWSDNIPSQEPVYTHVWQSTADYIGNARIGDWTTPVISVKGSKVDEQTEQEKSVHFIYTASRGRPALSRRANDPTVGTDWSSSQSSFKRRDIPIWQSRAVKDQDGNLIGTWSVPVQITGDDGREVELSVDEAGTIMQKYADEEDGEKRPVATREEIIKTIETKDLGDGVITNAKLGAEAVKQVNIANGEIKPRS